VLLRHAAAVRQQPRSSARLTEFAHPPLPVEPHLRHALSQLYRPGTLELRVSRLASSSLSNGPGQPRSSSSVPAGTGGGQLPAGVAAAAAQRKRPSNRVGKCSAASTCTSAGRTDAAGFACQLARCLLKPPTPQLVVVSSPTPNSSSLQPHCNHRLHLIIPHVVKQTVTASISSTLQPSFTQLS
jgi:hypothetical protein